MLNMNIHHPDDERLIEALLFRSSEPIHQNRLKSYLQEPSDLQNILDRLQKRYEDRGIHLVRSGVHWSFVTATDLRQNITLGDGNRPSKKESIAFLETLAIIAYHQPVTRSDISAIRGTECRSDIMQRLVNSGWIKTVGKKDSIGKPMLWATSDMFLRHFGLESLEDLPSIDELRANGMIEAPAKKQEIYDLPSLLSPKEPANE